MRTQTLLTIVIILLCTFPYNLTAQCACDGGNVNISSTTYDPGVVPPSAIQWTSGQTGDFVFMPDCNNLGCTSFTPCIPAGTAIPQQCVPFSTLGVPLNGTVPAGGSVNLNFKSTWAEAVMSASLWYSPTALCKVL